MITIMSKAPPPIYMCLTILRRSARYQRHDHGGAPLNCLGVPSLAPQPIASEGRHPFHRHPAEAAVAPTPKRGHGQSSAATLQNHSSPKDAQPKRVVRVTPSPSR